MPSMRSDRRLLAWLSATAASLLALAGMAVLVDRSQKIAHEAQTETLK